MFQRIVVPLDGSLQAERALPVAARMARSSGASLTLLRVVVPLNDLAWRPVEPGFDERHFLEQERSRANAYVQTVATREDLLGIKAIIRVADGNPAQVILSEALTDGADLIVMCSHGETGLKRWMVGSVSLQVVRHSSIPVLIVRPKEHETPALETAGPVRVMVPLDGSILAEEALAPALALANALSTPQPGAIHLTSVVPTFTVEPVYEQQVVPAAQTYLSSVEQRLRESVGGGELSVTSSITLFADVADTLVKLAETGEGMESAQGFTGCDVIAMATHGRSGIARWMAGSVTERVLHATRIPVLIVRPQQVHVKQHPLSGEE